MPTIIKGLKIFQFITLDKRMKISFTIQMFGAHPPTDITFAFNK